MIAGEMITKNGVLSGYREASNIFAVAVGAGASWLTTAAPTA